MKLPYESEYIPNVPKYIQDIIFIHRFRKSLHSDEEREAFDWYMDYITDNPGSYPQPQKPIVED